MEDELAEIELLEQNLNKTKQISRRMISILTNFDNRLVKVEKSILPLYNSTQLLNRRASNIESTLQRIREVSSDKDTIANEESLILRGPQPNQLRAYSDAIERLNTKLAFKASDPDSSDMARLVETGVKKLSQLYTKLVAEGSSGGLTSVSAPDSQPPPFPPNLLTTLRPLVAFFRTLPVPATFPSHPAAQAIFNTLQEAQRGYADMRGSWGRKCLEAHKRRVVERSETLEGIRAGREVGQWVDNLLSVAESEHALLVELAPLQANAIFSATFAALLGQLLSLFNSALSFLNNMVKRNVGRHVFLALSLYDHLSRMQPRWDDVMLRRAGRKENELKDGLSSLRNVCLRSFPEFLADLRSVSTPQIGVDIGTSIADFVVSTATYMETIPDVKDAVGTALLTLGDGNWKMGEGVQLNNRPKELDDRIVLEHYLYDVLTTLLNSLTALSRAHKKPAIGAIFLLNNVSYIRSRILLDDRGERVRNLLAQPAQVALQSAFRVAKAGYFDANFTPLIQALAEEGPGAGVRAGAGRAATKERFTRFFDLLEEVAERHRVARVLPEDREGRDTVAEEVVKLVVPSLQRFLQKYRDKDFSKNPQKYIKMTPEEVEAEIRRLY